MGGASSQSRQRPHVAVVVVHGVGEVVPGEIASALLDTMDNSPAITADKPIEILHLDDRVPGQREGSEQRRYSTTTFPAHVHTAKLESGGTATFAELYWADLTHVGSGRVNTFLGLIRVLFEAHYLIDAMLNRRGGFLTRLLRFLLLALSQILRGPLVALTICTAVVCWVGINAQHVGLTQTEGWLQGVFRGASIELAFIVAMVVLALAAAALAAWLWRAGDLTWLPMLVWTVIFALLAATAFALSPDGGPIAAATGMRWSYELLIWIWRGWGAAFFMALLIAVLMALGSCLLTVVRHLRHSERRIGAAALTAAGTLALQFLLWSALSGTLLLPILGRAEEIVALTAINAARDGKSAQQFFYGQGRPAVIDGDSFKPADLYDKVDKLLDVPTFYLRDFEWIERFKYAYGYNAVIVIAFLLVFLALVGLRRIVVMLAGKHLRIGSWFMPRLLFNVTATTVLLAFVLVQLVINIILSENFQHVIRDLQQQGSVTSATPLGWLFLQTRDVAAMIGLSEGTVRDLVIANRYTILGVAAFLSVGLPLLLGNSLNNALHIARDLIDHHYGPREGRAYAAAADVAMSEDERRPRRARIRHRLHELIEALNCRGPIDGVVFVAHSQGSVIVFDYLADAGPRGFPELGGLKPAIVTCGSPLTHLYECYFHEYASLGRDMQRVAPALCGWSNLYRIDDYIGVRVGRDERLVVNTILPRGGHANYWKQAEIAAAVHSAVGKVLAARDRVAPQG